MLCQLPLSSFNTKRHLLQTNKQKAGTVMYDMGIVEESINSYIRVELVLILLCEILKPMFI